MKALLVCAAPVAETPSLVARLSDEFDLLIGVDAGAAVCLAAGLLPDLVVGDLDSLSDETSELLMRREVEILRYPAEKDVSDLDLALAAVRERGVSAVTVTGAFSYRLDHTIAALGSVLHNADLTPEIREPELDAWVLASGSRQSIVFDAPGSTVSVVTVDEGAVVSCTGMKWNLDHAVVPPLTSLGLSNVTESAGAAIVVHGGTVLVMRPKLT